MIMGWFSDIFNSSLKDYDVGFREEFSLGFFTQLLYKHNGWYLWKTVNGDSISLMLTKSAIDVTTPPKPSGLVWCFGGLGVYAHRVISTPELYASFYGQNQFRGSIKFFFNNKLYTSLTESNLLEMEGSIVRFEVTSSPIKQKSGGKYQLESSSVDFSGIGEALKVLNSEYQTLIMS
ncbi:hypothetical protein [Vibrio sp. MA40-2]|uniref:hypothetical protein n=1 Tax=Vibrio sp. MA40-2 TaxID=3391828 RepID=UPI0039A60F4C